MPRAVSAVSVDQDSLSFEGLLQKIDLDFTAGPSLSIDRFQFEFDGIAFDVRRLAEETGQRLVVTAALGSLPFSIESIERRNAIKTIVLASHHLPNVRFTISQTGKISAGAVIGVSRTIAPDFIFYPLILFLQEALPFIRLIGGYLEGRPSLPAQTDFIPPDPASELRQSS